MDAIRLNKMSAQAHRAAVEKGFPIASLSHNQALIFTEVCEAIEADRKGRHADRKGFEISSAAFSQKFEATIKDTVEDELADTMIRILDLSGNLEVDFTRIGESKYFRQFHKFDFPENAYGFIKGFCNENIPVVRRIVWAIAFIEDWANQIGFDLWWHVEKKMSYNTRRPAMHGKNY